jgi:hypothetical protein
MPHFVVEPLVGVGPVRLGAARGAVIAALGQPRSTFRKTSDSQHPTDAWFESGFQIFYTGAEPVVEYIELSHESGFTAALLGRPVFTTPALDLISHIEHVASFDPGNFELGYSYIFPSIELSLWRPVVEWPEGRFFHTVGIGAVGCYSRRGA